MHVRIFLSFNSKDRDLARAIRAGLLKLDSAADIFLDEISLGSGFWLPKIFGRIADSDAFLFLIGPSGIGQWQEIEYFSAFQRHVEEHGKMPLVPVIAANAEAPGLAGLRSLNWVVAPSLENDTTLHRIWTALKGEAIDATSTPLWKLVNPYRGLEAMTEANADYFYGRSAETAKVLTSLAEKPSHLPVLVGPSGAGKTSIALAGVLSSLKSMRWPAEAADVRQDWPSALQKSRGWAYLTVRPGETPIKSLVSAFARLWSLDLTDPEQAARPRSWIDRLQDGKNALSELIDATQEQVRKREGEAPEAILVYLDQAEELYTLSNRNEAASFSRLISDGLKDPRLRAFATLRADDLDFFRADSALFGCAELVTVNQLTHDQLHLVVTKPPELLKVAFEDEFLARRLTEAAEKEPGALPLLSDQLNSMWLSMVKRGDATLRLPSQAIDVGGVLTSRAEDFIKKHPDREARLKRLLTLKLTTVHSDGEPVSRQATRDECSDAEWTLASSLADSQWRLVVTGTRDSDGKVVAEIAHDALLRAWPRLAGWLAEERDFLIFKGDAERKNREWREGGKQELALLVGRDLARADQYWGLSRQDDLPKDVVEFVQASRIFENQRKEVQIRLQRRLLVGQAVLLVVAILSASLWIVWREAREQLHNVQRDQSFRLAKLAEQRSGDAGTAMLLALEALPDSSVQNDRPFVAEAELQLDRALRSMHESLILPAGDTTAAAAFSSDGGQLITVSPLTAIATWDAASGKPLGEPVAVEKDAGLQNATFSPDSRRVAMVLEDGHILVRNLDNNETLKVAGSSPRRAAFSYDGKRLATASGDGMARIYDLVHPDTPVKSMQCSRESGIELVEFSPRGTRIAVASHDGPAAIFDIETGQQVGPLLAHGAGISSIAYNAEGTRLLTTSQEGTIKVWDVETGTELGTSFEAAEEVRVARFSPDGKHVAAGSADGVIRIWDVEGGAPLQAFSGNASGAIASLAFSPDGSRIVSAAADDRTARVWSVEKPNPMLVDRPIRHDAVVRDARFSASGNQVVTASEDGTAMVWDLQNQAAKRFKSLDGKLTTAAFDPAGTGIVAGSVRGMLQIWDLNGTGRQSINAHNGEIWALAFSPDGKQLLTASEDGTAKLWDYAARKLIRAIGGGHGAIRSAAFSPDGNLVATGYLNKITLLWDARTGDAVQRSKTFGVHNGTVRSVTFSPDGKRIMTASADKSIKFWDTATGAVVPSLAIGGDGSMSAIRSALFSPNGAHIVTASEQGGVQIWDPKTGNVVRELIAGDAEVWKASFSPDGERIAVASANHTASVWRVPRVQQLVDQAKAALPRCLTPDERSSLFLSDEPPDWCRDKWPYNTPELKMAPRPPRMESMFRRWFGAGSSYH